MPAPHETFFRHYKKVESDWDQKKRRHWWIVPLNHALETLCRNKPGHSNAAEVYAKVSLINRAYRANLQLSKKVDWPEWEVAQGFVQIADSVITPLRALPRLDRLSLGEVVRCHGKLMELVKKVTGTWNISFCSKYLSFHFPNTVPIYDSVSCKSAKELAKEIVPPSVKPWSDSSIQEWEFGRHSLRVLSLLERLKKARVSQPKLRIVDFVLYSVHPETKN